MKALLLDKTAMHKIAQTIAYAQENPLTLDSMEDRVKGLLPAIGSDPRHCVTIERGYTCCYSHEPDREGRPMHHLSVSLTDSPQLPNPAVVATLLEVFGFAHALESDDLYVYPESSVTNSTHNAVNMVEYLPPTSTRH